MKHAKATNPGQPSLHVDMSLEDTTQRAAEEAAFMESALPKLIKRVKVMAGDKILEIAPEWKQRNMIARSVELVEGKATRTAAEEAEMAFYKTVWAQVEAIRYHSGILENELMAAEDPSTVDINSGWPE